jgi:hypothetical protein
VIFEEVREVVGRVAGGCDRAEQDAIGEVDFLTIADVAVWRLEIGAARGDEGRTARGKLGAARHIVGVAVCVGRPRDQEATLLGGFERARGQARRVDRERVSVAQVHEVARVSEPFVDKRGDAVGHGHVPDS